MEIVLPAKLSLSREFCLPYVYHNNFCSSLILFIWIYIVILRYFKSLVSTIPPRGHVLGGANIAIVDAV